MAASTEWIDLTDPTYTPGRLLDEIGQRMQARSDSELSRRLGLSPAITSRIRNKRHPLDPFHYVQMMDALPDLRLYEIRELCGVRARIEPVYTVKSCVTHLPGVTNKAMVEKIDLVRKMAQSLVETCHHMRVDLSIYKDEQGATVFTVTPKREAA